MVQHQLPVGLQDATYGGGGVESTKLLGMLHLPWQEFEKNPTKIEAHAGMAERLVRDLAIEKALQTITQQ